MSPETHLACAIDATAAPAPKAKRPFEFVRDDGRRADGINALFNRFTGRSRTAAQYRWEFCDGPPPRAHVWAIVDAASSDVVGHHGIVSTPMLVDGEVVPGGRTENTIIEPAVRQKIFYPGMEKKAFKAALEEFALLYTVHGSGPQGRIRERLGYRPVGRWNVFLPSIGAGYFAVLLGRVRDRLVPWVPDAFVRAASNVISAATAPARLRPRPRQSTCAPVADLAALEAEYRMLWEEARPAYGVTIDRSWEFLRWRVFGNPNLAFSVWAIRCDGRLEGIVIGHRHHLGRADALYVDDIVMRRYDADAFSVAVRWLPFIARDCDACVVMTLDAATPLRAALRRAHRLQALALDRLAPRLFDEMVVYDRDERCGERPWYVTPIFTEGLDTSQPEADRSRSAGVAG
jgi:hypothetical protein